MISALKYVSYPIVSPVVFQAIDAVELPHSFAQIAFYCFDQQMVMIHSFYGGWNLYNSHTQILAEAGIYVLSPSPRGSSGFGHEFKSLNDKDLGGNEIIDIINPMFDFSLMAKLTLGKKYWPALAPEQKDRFTRLFLQRLRASYLDRLTHYTDEKVLFESPVAVNKKIHIPTYLVSQNQKISIRYKFYNSESNWKIYDLEIQGVSIIRSYRSQFHEILKSGTIDDLLTKLESQPAISH